MCTACVRVCLGIIQFNGSSKLVTQSYECYLLSFYNSSKKVLSGRQYTVGMSPASVHPSHTHTANGKIVQYLNEDHTFSQFKEVNQEYRVCSW